MIPTPLDGRRERGSDSAGTTQIGFDDTVASQMASWTSRRKNEEEEVEEEEEEDGAFSHAHGTQRGAPSAGHFG